MSSPRAEPRPVGEFKGRVVRWGAGGFGFISVAELGRDVYFNDRSIVGDLPAVGDEVELQVVEFPGDKLVARSIRGPSGVRQTDAAQPLRGGIRGISAVMVTPLSAPLPSRPSAPSATDLPRTRPASLGGVAQATLQDHHVQIERIRQRIVELEAVVAKVAADSEAVRAEAARKRHDLEREIAEGERSAELRVEELQGEAERGRDEVVALHARMESLEGSAGATVHREATSYIAAEAARVVEDLEHRTRALERAADERARAIQAVGEGCVGKYDDARGRRQASADADMREAFGLLERQRRDAVRAYAEALDATEQWPPLDVPVWQVGLRAEDAASAIVAPLGADALESSEPTWRLAATLCEALERARVDLSLGGAEPAIELGSVAGCLAIRIDSLDTELLPLILEEAQDARPSLGRLAIKLRWEEVPELRLPFETGENEVKNLESETLFVAEPASGGSTREIAARLGFDLEELIAVLVDRGLPFPDDHLDDGTEVSLRALLGVEAPEPPEPLPAAPPDVAAAPALPIELQIAARLLGKLLRAHVIGGKHTAVQNVYGHHFSDADKELAKDVTERLIVLGVLREKTNVGQRHVSIDPRRLDQTRALAEQRCQDPGILRALVQS